MTDKLIIMVAGASSRMKRNIKEIQASDEMIDIITSRHKSLIPIGKNGLTMLHYILDNAKKAGFKTIYLITSKENKIFKSYFGEDQADYKGLQINYVVQSIPKDREKPLGTADALFQAMQQYPELKETKFVICNGDNLYSENMFAKIRSNEVAPQAILSFNNEYLGFPRERIHSFAVLETNEDSFLVNIVEKPQGNELLKYEDENGQFQISMNIFQLDGTYSYEYMKNCKLDPVRNEKDLPTAILNCVRDNSNNMKAIKIKESLPDLTSPKDIEEVNKHFE